MIDRVDLVQHQQRVLGLDAQLFQHLVDGLDLLGAAGLLASATCSSKSAWRASSSVALKLATRWCGRSRMKPTVSLSSTGPQSGQLPAAGAGVERGEQLVLDVARPRR